MNKVDFNKFVRFLEESEKERFFGEIIFKFRNGEIYVITKTTTLKPEDI